MAPAELAQLRRGPCRRVAKGSSPTASVIFPRDWPSALVDLISANRVAAIGRSQEGGKRGGGQSCSGANVSHDKRQICQNIDFVGKLATRQILCDKVAPTISFGESSGAAASLARRIGVGLVVAQFVAD